VDRRGGKSYGPPPGTTLTFFVDDMSMPEPNMWGDQPTLELLRQQLELGGMYFLSHDRRGEMKSIEDVQVCPSSVPLECSPSLQAFEMLTVKLCPCACRGDRFFALVICLSLSLPWRHPTEAATGFQTGFCATFSFCQCHNPLTLLSLTSSGPCCQPGARPRDPFSSSALPKCLVLLD
jgi:hypothetical protein